MKLCNIKVCSKQIPLIYEQDINTNLVNLRLIFKNSGAIANEIPGTAHLLALILDEGSKKRGSKAFAKELEIKAIDLNIHATSENFIIEIVSLKEHFGTAISLLAELLNEPNFSDETLALVRTKTLGLISAKKSDLDYQAKLILHKLIYENSSFEHSSLGDEKSISKITLKDLREFYLKNLCLDNLFIVLGGNVKLNEVDLNNLNISDKKANNFEPVATSDKCQSKKIKMPSEQAYIYFGAPFNVPKDERFKAQVASFILGSSGFGSRLLEEIRVKNGLAYSAYTQNVFTPHKNAIIGYLQTKNENEEKALALVKKIFEKFVKEGVSEDELNSAKNFLIGSETLSKETLFKRLNIAQHEHFMGYELGQFERNLSRISALKLGDLNDFIRAHGEICKMSTAIVHG